MLEKWMRGQLIGRPTPMHEVYAALRRFGIGKKSVGAIDKA
jgi:hypothetical protein